MENTLPANLDLAAPTETSPKLRDDVQLRAIEKYIQDSGRFLEEARLSPTILETLQEYGFSDEEMSVGMSLQHEALNACCAGRGGLPTDLDTAEKELDLKIAQARDEYRKFCLVARAAFPGLSDRVSLRVAGDVPDDLQRFLNKAHAAYTAAGEAPYAEKMAKRGYGGERLKSLNEYLDALTWLDAAHDAASEAAEPAPADGEALDAGEVVDREGRDAAYNALKEFMKELKGVARAAFRKEPEVLEKLGLVD